ncbi:MAG TPA: Lon-like protease helical domain-containing protein, partial [Stellaceae bacterium]|nr:Lon-like protease helical domain-containing protein [Stellaceae bacterium]
MTDQKAARVADAVAGLKPAGPAFDLAQPLPPALLYRRCEPAELPFALCSELDEAPGLIGQERAAEAIRFGIRIQRKGYNVYALGPTGSGRHALVQNLLRQQAESDPAPPDWCYVNNFADPQKPYSLRLPAGRGAGLAAAMKRLVEELRAALPAAFERDEYRSRREVIDQQFKQRNETAFGALQKRAQQKSITLLRTPMGLALAPVRDGKVLEPGAFEALPEAEREAVQREIETIQGELEALMRQVPQWEREHRDAVRDLSRETTGFAIVHLMGEIRFAYGDLPEVAKYLDAVEADIKENADDFLTPLAPPPDAAGPGPAPI